MYLEMTGCVRDERRLRILHQLSRGDEVKAELLERQYGRRSAAPKLALKH